MYVLFYCEFLVHWALNTLSSVVSGGGAEDPNFEMQRFLPTGFELANYQGEYYVQKRGTKLRDYFALAF